MGSSFLSALDYSSFHLLALLSKFQSCLIVLTNNPPHSSSPLNGQAAELWDTDMPEFKRQVLARHQELEDDEEG